MSVANNEPISVKKEVPKAYDGNDVSLASWNVVNQSFQYILSSYSPIPSTLKSLFDTGDKVLKIIKDFKTWTVISPKTPLINCLNTLLPVFLRFDPTLKLIDTSIKLINFASSCFSRLGNYFRSPERKTKEMAIGTALHAFNLVCATDSVLTDYNNINNYTPPPKYTDKCSDLPDNLTDIERLQKLNVNSTCDATKALKVQIDPKCEEASSVFLPAYQKCVESATSNLYCSQECNKINKTRIKEEKCELKFGKGKDTTQLELCKNQLREPQEACENKCMEKRDASFSRCISKLRPLIDDCTETCRTIGKAHKKVSLKVHPDMYSESDQHKVKTASQNLNTIKENLNAKYCPKDTHPG